MAQIIEVPGMGRVEFPDDMTDEQIVSAIRSNITKEAAPAEPTTKQKGITSAKSRFILGAAEPIAGIGQMLYSALPNEWQKGIDNVISQGKPLQRAFSDSEAEYQAARKAVGQEGFDGMRALGNIASTIPMAANAPLAAASMPARVAQSAAIGGLLGGTNPVYQGDFLEEKGKQIATGMLGGAAAYPVAAGVGRVVSPKVSEAVSKLKGEGVVPAPGQILGGFFKATEEKMKSLPLMGDMMHAANKRSLDQFNRAAYNRALKPLGKNADDFPVGHKGVEMVKNELSKAYDDVLPKLTFQADDQFSKELMTVREMAKSLPESEYRQFEKILKEKVIKKMTESGRMSGDSLKAVESILGKEAKGYRASADYDKKKLGEAFDELQRIVRATAERNSPEVAKELQAINKGFANYTRIRAASKMAKADEGFTPSQLDSVVRRLDKSQNNAATGNALMQDLSSAGAMTLSPRYPDSGTAGRLLTDIPALASGFIHPAIPVSLLAGGLPYTPIGQKAMMGLLTSRPSIAPEIAEGVKTMAPVAGYAASGLLSQ